MIGVYEMTDRQSKTEWEAANVIRCTVKINRNQDPELYAILQNTDSVSGTIRDLAREALSARKSKETK